MDPVVAGRQLHELYIVLDVCFLFFFGFLLFKMKEKMALIVGILAGILYQVVDFVGFYLLDGSRVVTYNGKSTMSITFWVLLWMSMSYGFTNFTWIWLWVSKDKNLFEWTLLILGWWVCCPLLTKTFGSGENPVIIQRTTGAYHGYMAVILFVGYVGLILWNVSRKKKEERVNIPWLLVIGILVQFGWEAGLFLGGIRSAALGSTAAKIAPMIINSLLETNLGMPYIFAIFIAFSKKYTESLKRRANPLSFAERIVENNNEKSSRYDDVSEYLA